MKTYKKHTSHVLRDTPLDFQGVGSFQEKKLPSHEDENKSPSLFRDEKKQKQKHSTLTKLPTSLDGMSLTSMYNVKTQ